MKNQRINKMSSRHSRFGTSIIIKDKLTDMNKIIPTMAVKLSKPLEIGLKTAVKRKSKKEEGSDVIQIHKKRFGVSNYEGTAEEEETKKILKDFAIDFIENSHSQLFEVLLNGYYSQEEKPEEEHEKFEYIKMSTFFMEMCRLKAHEDFKQEQEKWRKLPQTERGPEPKLDIPISNISSSLKIQNIDYVFSKGFFQKLKERKSERQMDMYLASVEFFLELLYIIKDIDKIQSKNMDKNSETLKQKIFTLKM